MLLFRIMMMMMLLWWWMVGRDLERHGKMSRSKEFSKHLWWNGKSSSGTKNDSVRCLLSWNIIHKTEKRREEEEYSCENEAEKYDKALGGGVREEKVSTPASSKFIHP